MSNVNIRRAVENIRSTTNVYTPIVELIVNAIQAIDESARSGGKITIRAHRSAQTDLADGLPEIIGFDIEDNGVGFTRKHRDSFDELYTDAKEKEGAKGFGRFICLKYFEDLRIESVFREHGGFKARRFSMGKERDIVVGEEVTETEETDTGSIVSLQTLKRGAAFDKKLPTIARNLVERLLPYFITKDYSCPAIELCEVDAAGALCLNDFVSDSSDIREIAVDPKAFTLSALGREEQFVVRVFKFYSPRNQVSRISLVAHKREVSPTSLHKYVPEFVDEFYDKDRNGADDRERNYIIRAYVFGEYLDNHVSLERGGFEFGAENDLTFGISQSEIEKDAAAIARNAVGAEISFRQERKKERVQSYVDSEAPWHKDILNKLDLSGLPYNPTNEDIETRLQKLKFEQEVAIKREVEKILSETSLEGLKESVATIVTRISDNSRNDLTHYIVLRRRILDILGKSLEKNADGKYADEGIVHDIIFPRKGNTETTAFHDHNLWILDERLNFTAYVSSDIPLTKKKNDVPDLLVYNRRVLFRGDNEPSNPITIFEFKKPQREDFVRPSSKEDPVQQIVRYVNAIRDGKYKTPEGRKILVAENTPFYGYVVCDLTGKVEEWLKREKEFSRMPDGLGWFRWMPNINLYVEVLSWDKIVKDAKMRNAIFFQKLGI